MAPAAREPSRGLNRDTSMRLNQVFDKPSNNPYGGGAGDTDEDGPDEANNDASVLSRASSTRRSRVDRNRSSSQRLPASSSTNLNQLSQLPVDASASQQSFQLGSVANLSMEEDMSVQSSASRRASRGGRHRLTSATARRTSVTQDSILGLSANLMKAINGAQAAEESDATEDEGLLMESSQRDERPQAPSRTRSRLSERVKSRRSLTGTEGGSGVMTNESCQSHSSTRKPQRTRDVNARRHHSMRASSGMEKQPSSRKLSRKGTNERPRRTKSHQVVENNSSNNQENKSTDGEGSEQTPPPPPPPQQQQSVTPRRSRPNEHSPSTRRTSGGTTRKSSNRPQRAGSADRKNKSRRPTKSKQPSTARKEKRKPKSSSTSEARGNCNNEEEDLDGSFPSRREAMDGSSRVEGSHQRRASRHQRIHENGTSGGGGGGGGGTMMKDGSSKRHSNASSNHLRRKNTKDSVDNSNNPPLRRKQSHDKVHPSPHTSKKNYQSTLSPTIRTTQGAGEKIHLQVHFPRNHERKPDQSHRRQGHGVVVSSPHHQKHCLGRCSWSGRSRIDCSHKTSHQERESHFCRRRCASCFVV